MRATFLTFLAFAFALATQAAAQQPAQAPQTGRVTDVGVGGYYDPLGWVPLRVALDAPAGVTGTYTLRVVARDLDGDVAHYNRPVTLTAGGTQRFWTYARFGSGDPQGDLRVELVADDGTTTRLATNPSPAASLLSSGVGQSPARLVLVVGAGGGGYFPGGSGLSGRDALGIAQATLAAGVTTADLPDRVTGYDAVSAVVWQDADPADLLAGDGSALRALVAWVEAGGHLVVTHPGTWQQLAPLADLLPVVPTATLDLPDAGPLAAAVRGGVPEAAEAARRFATMPGPVRFVEATPKPDALVDAWFRLPLPTPDEVTAEEPEQDAEVPDDVADDVPEVEDAATTPRYPLLVRRGYGFGCVTWLATDLSRRGIYATIDRGDGGDVGGDWAWTLFWTNLLFTGDAPTRAVTEGQRDQFVVAGTTDLGAVPQRAVRLGGRGTLLVLLAFVFFCGYWLLVGPGLYFWLRSRKRLYAMWYAFAMVAVAAAVLTLGLARVVLGGGSELRHVTLLRQGLGQHVVVGEAALYVPRDGVTEVRVGDAADASVLSAMLPRDTRADAGGRARPATYGVDKTGVLGLSFRSSLKKLQLRSAGPRAGGFEGNPTLEPGLRFPTGRLTNTTGYDLANVHIVYRESAGSDRVTVVHVPVWEAGRTVESVASLVQRPLPDATPAEAIARRNVARRPPGQEPVHGDLVRDWAETFWYGSPGLRVRPFGQVAAFDDWAGTGRISPAMLSLHTLLPPMRNFGTNRDATRLVNRGARLWDISPGVAAGNLVIIAEAEGVPLPVPLTADGRAVAGTGTVVVQCVVPLRRPTTP